MDIKASVSSSLPEEWSFLAEGGAHVVFRYVGPNRALRGLVLRVAKTEYPYEQCNEIVLSLLSSSIDIPFYTHVSNDFAVELLNLHAGSRETKRLSAPITSSLSLVSLMPDYHFPKGPGFYSVEIKPKYSCCLSVLKTKLPLNSRKHLILCRFCNHNYAGTRYEDNGTRYCPSLLFSRDPALVRLAILGLCQNPRNNFRLFNNGQLAPASSLEESLLQQTVDYICNGPLIKELSRCLDEVWEKILLSTSYTDGDLMRAVILRDCSIILHDLHVCADFSRICANIIDFDPKPGVQHGKYEKEIAELRRLVQRFGRKEI